MPMIAASISHVSHYNSIACGKRLTRGRPALSILLPSSTVTILCTVTSLAWTRSCSTASPRKKGRKESYVNMDKSIRREIMVVIIIIIIIINHFMMQPSR
ncbi:hypothetical protein F4809DRAFT_623631 [Biscogniauxia mediterranea]|nr:hypothetical protein F4809DRAFT_623631 [Biscogniauxia mediterranea]